MFQMWARQLQQMNAAKAKTALSKRSQPQNDDTEEIVLDGDAVTSAVRDNMKYTPIIRSSNSSSSSGDVPTEAASITPRQTTSG